MSTLEQRWQVYRTRNDCIEVYPRRLYGARGRALHYLRLLGPRAHHLYLRWLGAATREQTFRCITAISVVEHFGLGHHGDEVMAVGTRRRCAASQGSARRATSTRQARRGSP